MKGLLKGGYGLFFLAMGFFTWLMLEITWPFFSFRYDIGFLLSKQHVLYLDIWRYSFYIHISASLPLLLIGAQQFIPYWRKKHPSFHKSMGKAYVFIVLVLSAPTGFVMGYYANGGVAAQVSFMMLSAIWWVFSYLGYKAALCGNMDRHGKMMTRSYALTLSAILLRSYVYIIPFFLPLQGKEMYIAVAWMSWVPNLIVTEGYFYWQKRKASANRRNRFPEIDSLARGSSRE